MESMDARAGTRAGGYRAAARLAAALGLAIGLAGGAAPARAQGPLIGVVNGLSGNGWREEMVCAAKAEAAASGGGVRVAVEQSANSPATMARQIDDLVARGAGAIVVDPPSPGGLDASMARAEAKGVYIVAMDQLTDSPGAYQVEFDQVAYGRIGMEWLAARIGGRGTVGIVRGAQGAPADRDREAGIKAALRRYPSIKVAGEEYGGWNVGDTVRATRTLLRTYPHLSGLWVSGTGYWALRAFAATGARYIPMVDTDTEGFVEQLLALRRQGLTGAAVTNPAAIGGVGMALALRLLAGGRPPRVTLLQPEVWASPGDIATLQAHRIAGAKDPGFSVAYDVPGYTRYTLPQLLACTG